MIKAGLDLNYCKTFGFDKVGRPLFWMKLKNYRPEAMDKETSMRLLCYLFDYVCCLMKPNVDAMIVILDLVDFGYANYSFEMWKSAMEVATVSIISKITLFDRLCIHKECIRYSSSIVAGSLQAFIPPLSILCLRGNDREWCLLMRASQRSKQP